MSSNITIRPAQTADAARICKINRESLGYDYPLEKTRARLADILSGADRVFVACEDGEVVGYIHGSGYTCIYCDPLKNILAIAVDPAYQKRGVGRMLLAVLENWAREGGCAGVRLVSSFDRLGAHHFYLRCGYSHRKDQKNFIKYF